MGASNSPALAGKFGYSLLRNLRDKFELFGGVSASAYCWWTGLSPEGTFDPVKGYGLVLHTSDGPVCKLFIFMDDVLVHGNTYERCCQGLRLFFDEAIIVGILCHPKKLILSSQVVKQCGFLLDSTSILTGVREDRKSGHQLAL